MAPPSSRRSRARSIVLAAVVAPVLVGGCNTKKGGRETEGAGGTTTIASAAAASSDLARWRPVALPLQREGLSAVYAFPSASARLHIDSSGTRWLLPDPAIPASGSGSAGASSSAAAPAPPSRPIVAATIDLEPIERRLGMSAGELLLVTRDERLLKLTSPLAKPEPAIAARLPEGAVSSTLRRFHGATTVRAKRGLFWSSDGTRFVPLPGLAGHAPGEAIIDRRGVGVGLFFPEQIATTRDAGQTWKVIPLGDAHVTQLETRGDLVVALPGGIRDAFARSIDPLTDEVTRAPQSATSSPLGADEVDLASLLRLGPSGRRRRLQRAPGFQPEKLPPPRYVPGEDPRGLRHGPALDGDKVLAFEAVQDKRDHRSLRAATGLLGEALSPFGEEPLAFCNVLASALCEERAVVVCDSEMIQFRGGSVVARTTVAAGTVVSYDGEGRLWTASPRHDAEAGSVVLRRFPVDGALPSPGEAHAHLLGGTTPRFLGGCHAPALWVIGEKAASKLHGTGFEGVLGLATGTFPVGIAERGALVLSTGGELIFLPGEKRVVVRPHLAHHISFSEDGRHALLSTPSGQLEQSDDGGQSFAPVPTPPVLGQQAVACGRTRCQLGPSAVREGFGRDPGAMPARWPDPPRDDGIRALHRFTRPEERAKVVATDHFICRREDDLFRDAPRAKFAPRVGGFLFVSASDDDDPRPRVFFGGTPGSGESVALAGRGGREPRGSRPIVLGGGVGRAWLPPGADPYDPRGGEAALQWEPAGLPRTIVGRHPHMIERGDLWTSDGAATVHTDSSAGELWLLGANHDQRRQVAVSRLPTFERRGGHLGVVHVARDDVWYGVFPTPPSSDPDHVQTLGLLAAYADRPSEDRLVAVGPTSKLEIAAGLVPDGDHAALVLLERVESGDEIELRIRPLNADLQLGEAQSIPGTRGPASQLLRLPTCTAGAPGSLARFDALTPRRVRFDEREVVGYLVRLARITPSGACVERSYLVENRATFEPLLVVAGNEGVGFARDGGARCTLSPSAP